MNNRYLPTSMILTHPTEHGKFVCFICFMDVITIWIPKININRFAFVCCWQSKICMSEIMESSLKLLSSVMFIEVVNKLKCWRTFEHIKGCHYLNLKMNEGIWWIQDYSWLLLTHLRVDLIGCNPMDKVLKKAHLVTNHKVARNNS